MYVLNFVKYFLQSYIGISRFHCNQDQIHSRTMRNLNSLNELERKEFFDSIDTFLTDCDGVTWLSSEVIPGAADVINRLKEVGKSVFFAAIIVPKQGWTC
uniref:Phosphoglycolate phosphatase-like protein n=1 Tax=Triatoma infestans TaxID=30076 RepID=A0A161M2T1_TRIIF